MGITIPSELDFVLDLMGFEWPNVDEDVVREAAVLLRGLGNDLDDTLNTLQTTIETDLAEAFKTKAGAAYLQAFTDNKTQNMDQMTDLIPGVADGIDLYADMLVALKLKVIAELAITAAQIAVALAAAFVTFGASALISAGIAMARKKIVDIATDLLVDELIGQLLPMVLEPLMDTLMGLADAALDAPLTTSDGAEPFKFDVSYDLVEQLATAIDDCGAEQEELIDACVGTIISLPYSGA